MVLWSRLVLEMRGMDLRLSKKEITGFADGLKVCGGMEVKYSLASRFRLE